MKTRYLLLICLLPWLVAEADDGSDLRLLSDAEADAIVRAEVAARADREAARPFNRIEFDVLETREVSREGRTNLIMNRVTPPDLPPVPQEEADPYARFSEEELEVARDYGLSLAALAYLQRTDYLENVTLFLSATIYDREITRLRWQNAEGRTFTVHSNIDFNYLRGVRGFEAGDGKTYYTLMMGIGEAGVAANESHLPPPGTLDSENVGYVVSAESTFLPTREDLVPIDALHAWYQENEERLKIEHQRRGALNAAWVRHRAANPPEERPAVINFWPVEPPRR